MEKENKMSLAHIVDKVKTMKTYQHIYVAIALVMLSLVLVVIKAPISAIFFSYVLIIASLIFVAVNLKESDDDEMEM